MKNLITDANRKIRDSLSIFKNRLYLHAGLLAAGTFICAGIAVGKVQPCDCEDVRFEPSKERITITQSIETKKRLFSFKDNPSELQKIRDAFKTTDTFLQRHINGDLYQFQDPTGWEKYNGRIIAMSFSEWQVFAQAEESKSSAAWDLCPFAKRAAVDSTEQGVTVRYELTLVGRFTAPSHVKTRQYDARANGKPFVLMVTVGATNKVTSVSQEPAGWFSHPVMKRRDQHRLLDRLSKRRPRADFGETQQRFDEEKNRWDKQLVELNQAAAICHKQNQARE